ncbi:pyrroline-5-carboxylate reductase 3-like isoform X2 [Scylla paramamosain]|uniref:pyrroline-5-carboxylate reductase 3-like isoform X2 n=1 Tax=Scylla paramamosain TaxID=85552 RepID=UPI0030829562
MYLAMKDEMDTGLQAGGRAGGVAEVMNPASLGFIGCGNMAQAMLSAFLKKGLVDPHLTIASAPSERNLTKVRALGVRTTHDNNEVARTSDLVFLCVKPHLLSPVLADLLPLENNHSPLFVSVVTGVSLSDLEEMLSSVVDNPRVVRCMPNTPSAVGQGCCLYARGTQTTASDAEATSSLLSAVGMSAEIPEYQIDAACGLAGSGPAYIYMAIEALADGGVKMGLPRPLAQTLAAQTVKGAATMVLETGKHPGQLKDEVCSPGGTTIAAVHALEKNAFRNSLMSAVEASTLRSKELGAKK